MPAIPHSILVVGGNGFIGSAVCKAALARGMQVTSISSSGRPYKTPRGHSPAWTSKVQWLSGDAMNPPSYAHLLPKSTAVVHTLGTLLEDSGYKDAVAKGDIGAMLTSIFGSFTRTQLGRGNPLESGASKNRGTYEALNRDAALHVCDAYVSSLPETTSQFTPPRPFVYISAEDIFRPFIPSRYIETKREAEKGISSLVGSNPSYREVFIRPSLVYHPHIRPLTTPIAALLDLSSTLHSKIPSSFPIPTPPNILRVIGSALSAPLSDTAYASSLYSMANALTIPPIHVEHVAEAVCVAVENDDVRGVVGVSEMRKLIGWSEKASEGKHVNQVS